jgi:hypothetical protein
MTVAGGVKRLRVSSWFEPMDFMVLKDLKNKVPASTTDSNGNIVLVLKKDAITGAGGALDDVSLQRTIVSDAKLTSIQWDLLVNSPVSTRQNFVAQCAAACHAEGIQMLVGFALLASNDKSQNTTFDGFNLWLRGKPPTSPTIPAFAKLIHDFVMKNMPDCDGVSFDIEGLTSGASAANSASECIRIGKNLELLYVTLAGMFAGDGKLVAVATAGLTSRLHINPGRKATEGLVIQDTHLGAGTPNLLIRPMAYDNFTPADADSKVFAWHEQVIAYALAEDPANGSPALPPSQFQLGIKTFHPAGGTLGGFVTSQKLINMRCEKLLRKNNVGVVFFPSSVSFWKGTDAALNEFDTADFCAKAPGAGRRKLQPFQAPIDGNAATRVGL